MNTRIQRLSVTIALCLATTAAAALAGTESTTAATALPLAPPALASPVLALPLVEPAAAPALQTELVHVRVPDVALAGVHYRPRTGGWGRRTDSESVSQIHLGFFDPEGDASREFLVGLRGGPQVDPHIQVGVGLDWSHITDNASSVSRTNDGPGGTQIQATRALSRASTNLFPIMAFVQLSADDDMPVIPYFGLAGGYEVMHLSADDFVDNTSFDATYGGWGWQLWGGAAFPLSGRARVNGEIFVNTAEPSRDVTDPDGITYTESVKAGGIGMRLGIAWGF